MGTSRDGREGNPSPSVAGPPVTVIGGMNQRAMRAGLLIAVGYLLVGVVGYATSRPSPELDEGGGSLVVLWSAVGVLAVGARAVRRPSPLASQVAPWMLPAVVGPLALYPLALHPLAQAGVTPAMLAAVLWPVSALPLGYAVSGLDTAHRRVLRRAALLAVAVAMFLGLAGPSVAALWPLVSAGRFIAATAVAWLPCVGLVAVARGRARSTGSRSEGEILAQATLLTACLAPALTGSVLLVRWEQALSLMAVVTAVVLIGAWAALGPLSGATARANLQRDLALAVSEAERTRLAGDLHDGPLQDLLLLARRLEALGDREGASLARDIADELREVSGDLRLPLLDDLGVGPALEWLATRIRRLTGMDVSTSWEAAGRPPAPVELAAFRIAQEAVTNAVRHGRPPIRVTYRSTTQDLFMAIEDAGARSTEAEVANPGRMRLGLLGMTQRAEQIGARLVVRQAATEGTVVAVEWQETAAT